MNANAATAVPALAGAASGGPAFTSVTIWGNADYYLQVHYGYFDSWEEAEDFAGLGNLTLEERSGALFLAGPQGVTFIPDQAISIYRDFANSYSGGGTFDMTLDDLLEVADIGDMRLRAIGSQPVHRDRPIIARPIEAIELSAASAANDE